MTHRPSADATDAALVGLAKAGDREAFRILFDRHSPRVAAACRTKLRSQPDVDDAVQEAFFRALAHLDQLRDPEQFGPWVRSIALRACMNHHRAARRVVVLDADTHAERPDTAPQPDEVIEGFERDRRVRELLRQLGERDRQALYMRHINESGVPEIASSLGLTEGSTRVMLTRARERLRVVATGVGSFIPWTWRRWFRDHLGPAVPSLEVLAVAVVVGIAGGFVPPAAEARPPAAEVSAQKGRAPQKVRAEQRAKAQARAERDGTAPAGARARRLETAPTVRAAEAAPRTDRKRVLDRVGDSVDIRREYPKEEESQELADLTIFSAEDENSISVYGNQVTQPATKTAQAARELLGE